MNDLLRVHILCLLLSFLVTTTHGASTDNVQSNFEIHFKNAYTALDAQAFEKSLTEGLKAQRYNPTHYLTHAIICLDYYNIAEKLDVRHLEHKKKKIVLYEKMAQEAERGILADPDKGECYFFRGLAHARLSTTNGIFYSLFMAKGIESDWLKATQLEAAYKKNNGVDLKSSAHIALSIYYRLCPSFFIWQLVFGINGDADLSVRHAQIAYDVDPRIEVSKEYGISLISRGIKQKNPDDIKAGKNYLKKVLTMANRLVTDPIDKQHAAMLLKHIERCPNYSRDQQQYRPALTPAH